MSLCPWDSTCPSHHHPWWFTVAFCHVDQPIVPIKGAMIRQCTRPASPCWDFAQRSLQGLSDPLSNLFIYAQVREQGLTKTDLPSWLFPFILPSPQTDCPCLKARLYPRDLAGGGRGGFYSGQSKSIRHISLSGLFLFLLLSGRELIICLCAIFSPVPWQP